MKKERKIDSLKFHKKIDELICNWSMSMIHDFSEHELNSLVDMLGDYFKNEAVQIHKHGVHVGKQIAILRAKNE